MKAKGMRAGSHTQSSTIAPHVTPKPALTGVAAQFHDRYTAVAGYDVDVTNERIVVDFEFAALVIELQQQEWSAAQFLELRLTAHDLDGHALTFMRRRTVSTYNLPLATDAVYSTIIDWLDDNRIKYNSNVA